MSKLALKTFFRPGELASAMAISRWQLRRLLTEKGITVDKSDRYARIWLRDLQTLCPEAWESLLILEDLRSRR